MLLPSPFHCFSRFYILIMYMHVYNGSFVLQYTQNPNIYVVCNFHFPLYTASSYFIDKCNLLNWNTEAFLWFPVLNNAIINIYVQYIFVNMQEYFCSVDFLKGELLAHRTYTFKISIDASNRPLKFLES